MCKVDRSWKCSSHILRGSNNDHLSLYSSANQTITNNLLTVFAAVQNKPAINRDSKVGEHTHIHCDTAAQLTSNGKEEDAFFAQHKAYEQPFIEDSLLLKLIWERQPGSLTIAKHQIDISQLPNASIHLTSYWPGPKSANLKRRRWIKCNLTTISAPHKGNESHRKYSFPGKSKRSNFASSIVYLTQKSIETLTRFLA